MSPASGQLWYLLQTGAREAAENMALDELLLQRAGELGHPVLRFYSWLGGPASFGYAQRIAEIEGMTHLRPLIRRPTGGGLVPHNADWTYSLVFPPGHEWYRLKASASYQRVHQWLAAAFERLHCATELAPSSMPGLPGRCFVGAEQFDLLAAGEKIAGAAQRRNRWGLLIQGSVQSPETTLAKADWQKAMCDVAHHEWGVNWESLELNPSFEDAVAGLVGTKYSRESYNRRR